MLVDVILIVIAVIAVGGGILWCKKAAAPPGLTPTKKQKRSRLFSVILIVIGGYLLLTRIITLSFGGGEKEAFKAPGLWADRIAIPGINPDVFSLSTSIVFSWYAMAFIVVLAVILRLTILRKPEIIPRGGQNVLEIIVENILKYTDTQAHGAGEFLGSYIFTIAAFLVACACVELFGLRTPTSDITLTFALAFMTFIFINWYGIKKKGVAGRVKSLNSNGPVVMIIRVITDFAIPVSMACRLFGNMLGGMVVMDLIYNSLGNNAVGIPSVAGLYFNVFHPLIQAFIFVTLTLTFINEAIE